MSTSNASGRNGEAARPARLAAVLESRACLLNAVRLFFRDRGFLEVETPVRIPCPANELHINAIPSGAVYLRTSPELHMKRLLAAGFRRIFQMGPCFRQGEIGPRHNPEYTMLEWYRADADYEVVRRDAEELISTVARVVAGSLRIRRGAAEINVAPPWEIVTVADAFVRYAGWNPVETFDADRFDLDLVTKVEPRLPADRPVILTDYPVEAGALARAKPANPRVAERWELYAGGVELANAFSELTDAAEQKRRFEACIRARQAQGAAVYPVDADFIACLDKGMPECAGVALGIDRLLMLLTDSQLIAQVLPFRADSCADSPHRE